MRFDLMENEKIIQIMPASSGIWAVFQIKDDVKPYVGPIIAWGLTNDGQVLGLEACPDGMLERATINNNFIGYVWDTPPPSIERKAVDLLNGKYPAGELD